LPLSIREACAIVDVQVRVWASCGHMVNASSDRQVLVDGESTRIDFDAAAARCTRCQP
jgi:hypothetical protein